MNKMRWLCWHHGTSSNPKFRLIASRTGRTVAEVVAIWAALLEHASQTAERGDVSDLNPELIGLTLGLETPAVSAVLSAMQEIDLVKDGRVAEWDDQQNIRHDPTNAQRQRRHRQRNVTARYVTTQDRTEQHIQNSTDNTGDDTSSVLANATGDTIADLDLRPETDAGLEAIRIVQAMRPGGDPAVIVARFISWGASEHRPQRGWKKALGTFAKKERLSDAEMRAEQIARNNGVGPRLPGESAAAYLTRATPPISPVVRDRLCGAVKDGLFQ